MGLRPPQRYVLQYINIKKERTLIKEIPHSSSACPSLSTPPSHSPLSQAPQTNIPLRNWNRIPLTYPYNPFPLHNRKICTRPPPPTLCYSNQHPRFPISTPPIGDLSYTAEDETQTTLNPGGVGSSWKTQMRTSAEMETSMRPAVSLARTTPDQVIRPARAACVLNQENEHYNEGLD